MATVSAPPSSSCGVSDRACRGPAAAMVQAWWAAPPVAAAILFNSVFRRKSNRRSKKDEEASRDESGLSFSCERVCTSDTLLKRLGSLAKARAARSPCRAARSAAASQPPHMLRCRLQEPTPNTCVTVCGVSSASARRAYKPFASAAASPGGAHARRARTATDACTEACQRAVCLNTHQARAAAHPCRAHATERRSPRRSPPGTTSA